MIPKSLKKLIVKINIPNFIQNIDILYFKNIKGDITGKIDFTKKIIQGDYFKDFAKGE